MVRSAAKRRVSNHEAKAPRLWPPFILRDAALRAAPQDEADQVNAPPPLFFEGPGRACVPFSVSPKGEWSAGRAPGRWRGAPGGFGETRRASGETREPFGERALLPPDAPSKPRALSARRPGLFTARPRDGVRCLRQGEDMIRPYRHAGISLRRKIVGRRGLQPPVQ